MLLLLSLLIPHKHVRSINALNTYDACVKPRTSIYNDIFTIRLAPISDRNDLIYGDDEKFLYFLNLHIMDSFSCGQHYGKSTYHNENPDTFNKKVNKLIYILNNR